MASGCRCGVRGAAARQRLAPRRRRLGRPGRLAVARHRRRVAAEHGVARAPLASVDSPAPSSATVRYTADGPTTLVYQQSWAPGWEATVDGRPLGPPEPYDTFAGWRIDQTGPVEVQIRYRGQRIFDIGLLLTTIGVGTCLWLVLRRPRPPVDEARG